MEDLNTNIPEGITSSELRDKLIEGRIEPEEFLDQLFRLDQSTPKRRHADLNIEILTDPRIVSVFEKAPEMKFRYKNLLSLSYFHRGQREAIENSPEDARVSFKEALKAIESIEDADYQFWKDYIVGTIAYLERDEDTLQEVCGKIEEGRNKDILQNFLKDLKGEKSIDYSRAYNK